MSWTGQRLGIGIGLGIFYFSNQTHINMYNSNEVTILRDDTVWLTSGCQDSRSCFHPVSGNPRHSTGHNSSTVVALKASYRFWFRVGRQFKGSGIKGTIGHTRKYVKNKREQVLDPTTPKTK